MRGSIRKGISRPASILLLAVLSVFAFTANELAADDTFLGFRTWSASWGVGAVGRIEEDLEKMLPAGFGQLVENPRTRLTMLGITASRQWDAWSVNYGGAFGRSGFGIDRTFLTHGQTLEFLSASYIPMNMDVRVRRADHELYFRRTIGESGFSLFFGLKYQAFRYLSRSIPTLGLGGIRERTSPTSGETRTFSALEYVNTAFNLKSAAAGPAAGLAYTWAFSDRQSLSASMGLIYLAGNLEYEDLLTTVETLDQLLIPGNLSVVLLSSNLDQPFQAPGGTFSLTYSFAASENWILQVSLLHQSLIINAGGADYSDFGLFQLSTTSSFPPVLPGFAQLFNGGRRNFDGARDSYNGISLSILYRL